MTETSTLLTLAQYLAGEFENSSQALDQPAWFVRLRLWHRPLPQRLRGCLALFAEQANALYLDQPYRQRVMLLQENSGFFQVQYLALQQPEKFRTAGANPEKLQALTLADLTDLPGCKLTVKTQGQTFIAQPEPGDKCYFQYEGKTRQVELGFEAARGRFLSYDKGVDPDTGKALWGALMGPYEFQQQQDFAGELPLN